MYGIPNQRMTAHVVGLPMIWETPLRTGNLRDPNGPQVTFAFESFIDELAAAAKADPAQFRLDMIGASAEDDVFRKARSTRRRARGREDLRLGRAAFAETAQRPDAGQSLTGRGIAYTYSQQHHRRGDRRSRSQSRDRPRLGQSASCAPTTAAWPSIPKAFAKPSSAACCTA